MENLDQSVDVRVKGRWATVPAIQMNGEKLFTSGKWLRIASIKGEEMMEREIGDPEAYCSALKAARDRRLRADVFTFTQKLPAVEPRYSYPMEWESVAAIRLVSFKDWWQSLPQETRKNVRRSEKRNVTIRIEEFGQDLIDGIRSVNDDSPIRQGAKNAYYKKSPEETRKRYGEFVGRCDFICAYAGQEMIGFLHLVYRHDVASILNLTVKPSHSDKRPANALMARATEICSEKGVSFITYGLYNYGNKRDSSLREFKIRNGFKEVQIPRYFIPLNSWGKLCIKAKLHRGLIGLLPQSLIFVYLGLRRMWSNYKYSTAGVAQLAERPNCNRQTERSIPPAGSTS